MSKEKHYTDPTHVPEIDKEITEGKKDSISVKLAKWIREKMWGEDVRESMARFVLWMSVLFNRMIDKSDATQAYVENTEKQLDEKMKDFREDFDQAVNGLTQDSEVKLARKDLSGETHESLSKRLEADFSAIEATDVALTIEHNLDCYPAVRVYAWRFGLGLIPMNSQPSGINFDGTDVFEIENKTKNYSRQKLSVLVPKKYNMENPTIRRTASNEYVLTEGINSLKIVIGDNKDYVKQFVETTMKLDLRGRKAGSLKENPHSYVYDVGTTLLLPDKFRYGLINGDKTLWNSYESLDKLDGYAVHTTSKNKGNMAQQLIKFNAVEALERKFPVLFKNKVISEKVIIAKNIIENWSYDAFAFGKGASGYSVTTYAWNGKWSSATGHLKDTFIKIGYTNSVYLDYLNSDGYFYFLISTNSSDGVATSELKVDYVALELKIRSEM